MTGTTGSRQGRLALATGLALGVFVLALTGIHGQAASAGETARASATATVTIPRLEFKPATVTVGRGSKVRFSNTSGTAHTATRDGGFDTGRIKPGKSAAVTFNRKGTFAYHCKIHPSMKGKVVVD
jgi:plastocyanin